MDPRRALFHSNNNDLRLSALYAHLIDWHRQTLKSGLLFTKPGNDIISPTASRACPSQDLRVLALLSDPPVFLHHHQGPTAFAITAERENFHGESVLLTCEAVPLARASNTVQCPLRTLEAWIVLTHQKIKQP